jgi:hypothetical protein
MSSVLLDAYKIGNQNAYYVCRRNRCEDRKMAELNARVPCTTETRDELRALKTDAERYEDVLRRLIDDHSQNN